MSGSTPPTPTPTPHIVAGHLKLEWVGGAPAAGGSGGRGGGGGAPRARGDGEVVAGHLEPEGVGGHHHPEGSYVIEPILAHFG